MSKVEPIELKDFLKETLKGIEEGVDIGSRNISQPGIEIEVSTITTRGVGGSVKVYVLGVGGEEKQESIARLKFSVHPNYPNYGEDRKGFS